MTKLVEDIQIGDSVVITEEIYNRIQAEISQREKSTIDSSLIDRALTVQDTFDVSGEGRGFIISDGRKEFRFSKACGTYLQII